MLGHDVFSLIFLTSFFAFAVTSLSWYQSHASSFSEVTLPRYPLSDTTSSGLSVVDLRVLHTDEFLVELGGRGGNGAAYLSVQVLVLLLAYLSVQLLLSLLLLFLVPSLSL